jgi:hypothetical protein
MYRLDCGTGPGVVRTSDQVHLNAWNHLSVYRHDWGVWIQLNGGKQEEGRSQVQVQVISAWRAPSPLRHTAWSTRYFRKTYSFLTIPPPTCTTTSPSRTLSLQAKPIHPHTCNSHRCPIFLAALLAINMI